MIFTIKQIIMKHKSKNKTAVFFEKFAAKTTKATGSPWAFLIAFAVIIIWAITGPIFKYSDSWQLVINTGTTIITFLMVFVIQQSQNKDTTAIQLKLNELIAASSTCSNRLIDVEDLSSDELDTLKKFYVKLSALSKNEGNIHKTHSIDEAEEWHEKKLKKLHKHE